MNWTWYADVGNCTIHAAAWVEGRWRAVQRLPVDLLGSPNGEQRLLVPLQKANLKPTDCDRSVLCASALSKQRETANFTQRFLGAQATVAGVDFSVNLATDYYEPAQIGTDRLLNGLATVEKVGCPCLVIDLGSCLTCDAISAEGVLTAGAIAPGLPVIYQGLLEAVPHLAEGVQQTRKLLATDSMPTGRSTAEGLTVGIRACLAGSADRLVKVMRQTLSAEAPVVATGGDVNLIAGYCQVNMIIDEMLTLDGLRLAYEAAKR